MFYNFLRIHHSHRKRHIVLIRLNPPGESFHYPIANVCPIDDGPRVVINFVSMLWVYRDIIYRDLPVVGLSKALEGALFDRANVSGIFPESMAYQGRYVVISYNPDGGAACMEAFKDSRFKRCVVCPYWYQGGVPFHAELCVHSSDRDDSRHIQFTHAKLFFRPIPRMV